LLGKGGFHIVMSPNRCAVKPFLTSWTLKRQSGTATLSIILTHNSQQTVVATYTLVEKYRWEHSLRYSVQLSTRTQEEYTQARRIGWGWEILRFRHEAPLPLNSSCQIHLVRLGLRKFGFMLHSDILEPCSERLDLAESRILRTSIVDRI
jgi:hypothetical protein